MKPFGQRTIVTDVVKLMIALWVLVVLWSDASIAQPDSLDDVYTTRAVSFTMQLSGFCRVSPEVLRRKCN